MVLLASMMLMMAQGTSPEVVAGLGTTQITHVRVIDGTGRAPIENATVTLRDGKIAGIGPSGKTAVKGAKVIDGMGKTVMPGIINAHGHLALVNGTKNDADYYTREHVLDELRQYERYGVTTMLSLGLNRDLVYQIRAEQRAGKLDGASVFVADRGIGVPDGMPPIPHEGDQLYQPKTPEEARKDVDEAAGRHTDFVKIWVDDLYGTKPKMSPSVAQAVIEEAHKDGVPAAAHVFALSDAKGLVGFGVNVLAHSVRDSAVDAELLNAMKTKGVFYLPTLTVDESFFTYAEHPGWMQSEFFKNALTPEAYTMLTSAEYADKVKKDSLTAQHRKDFEQARKNMKAAYDAGVKVGFGTDSGASVYRVPGFAEHHELAMLVEAGLTPMQAIRAATETNASLLGISKKTGTLTVGKDADLILLGGNPLDDIRNTEKIVGVWHEGREVANPAGR
ncbi:amidohydrolase family protein [Granulicella sibirica]|uniref:M38 (Beta-aspartyl dipeptidase) family protein n=1 Tax=Granulicella sibirica TaxID=2479048 RepID=A0A4Q0T5L1_9BACT|nr:amidohydrolase family protein [Granulicella sibirica]RXH56906.1 M38 (beta-aspartyl dipeptidase) family protein [Granulicella sibirica]